jgi:hypothetical protein
MKIRVPENAEYVPNYLTRGKVYECDYVGCIVDDEGSKIIVNIPSCAFLRGTAWEVVSCEPIREVTKRELVAGKYGIVEIDNVNDEGVSIWLPANRRYDASTLREAAHTLNQIAEFLENE